MSKKRITGRAITRLREALELDIPTFADAFGVHASSVYRWEAATSPALRGHTRREILALTAVDDPRAVGAAIRLASNAGGRRLVVMQVVSLTDTAAPAA